MGVNIAEVTLHVGLGTFRPVKAEDISEHHMHTEYYRVTEDVADMINNTKKMGKSNMRRYDKLQDNRVGSR